MEKHAKTVPPRTATYDTADKQSRQNQLYEEYKTYYTKNSDLKHEEKEDKANLRYFKALERH